MDVRRKAIIGLALPALSAVGIANARDHRHDRDGNPPGRAGGKGTNWENPPGWRGGPGVSPDRHRHCR